MKRGRSLARLFQGRDFFQSGPVTGHSHAASVQLDLATLSSVLLVPSISPRCLDANGRIDLLAIGSLDLLTLQLPRKDQMRKGELTEF